MFKYFQILYLVKGKIKYVSGFYKLTVDKDILYNNIF